jgi:aminoglycoside phosphotransferase (APT) family kinase protein
MNNEQLAEICLRFRLGAPVAVPQPVAGGLLQRMWRIETTEGIFAVKHLHLPATRQREALLGYRRAERIAQEMAAQGIPAVTALGRNNGPVKHMKNAYVLVFPWVEGTTLPLCAASTEYARQIGTLLGRMHTLKLTVPGLALPTWRVLRDDDWVLLARRAAEAQTPWAENMRAFLRELCWWSRLARDANPRLWNTLAISHRDLGQTNVIWRNAHTPAIVDWESAGMINPTLELVGAALDWSGISVGEPDEASFLAVLAGYRSAGGLIQESAHDALAGVLGHWLEWLAFNMRRSLDNARPLKEQALSRSEIERTSALLQRLGESFGRLAAWVEG